ncbi:MAG: hypothetical protein JNL74_01245, partial [Fibrobacteres bacterium]|nr:hypothetical protein [Fibrobacterota bacterium]
AVIFGSGNSITPDLISFTPAGIEEIENQDRRSQKQFRLSKTGTEYICNLLSKHNGNVMRAAKELGISKISLYSFMKKRNIDVNKYRLGFDEHG